MDEPVIRIEKLNKVYHVGEVDLHVLKGVSVRIERGEMVAIMGASGSGKTTLMNIIGCMDRPTDGTYFLDGEEISRVTPGPPGLHPEQEVRLRFSELQPAGPDVGAGERRAAPALLEQPCRGASARSGRWRR
jgi:predicted ABC-type transport system involved in lysophospholipase L1 biosynthesis ATPase subunit